LGNFYSENQKTFDNEKILMEISDAHEEKQEHIQNMKAAAKRIREVGVEIESQQKANQESHGYP
jgi:hypothetical protein